MTRTILFFALLFFANSAYTQSLNWQWAKQYGGAGSEVGTKTAVDADGNVYMLGIFHDTITIGTYTLVSNGGEDVFLSKHNASGNVLWAKSYGGIRDEHAEDILLSSSGNIYIAGYFIGNSIFGPFISNSAYCVFLTKLDASGNIIWTTGEAYGSSYKFEGLAFDANQNIVLAGIAREKVVFGNDTAYITSAATSPFYAGFDTLGNVRWVKAPTARSNSGASDLATDKYGHFYSIGYSRDSIRFSATEATPQGIFVTKHQENGEVIWARSMTGSNIAGSSIEVDENQNVYIGGIFGDTGRIGNFILPGDRAQNFLAALDSNGNAIWAKALSSTSHDSHMKLTTSGANYLIATGNFYDSIRMGNVLRAYPRKEMPFIVKLEKSGNFVWGDILLGSSNGSNLSVTAGIGDEMYISGGMLDSLRCGATRLTSAGDYDIFLAKLSSLPNAVTVLPQTEAIKLYPQPSTGRVSIEFQPNSFHHVNVTDQLGRSVFQQQIPINNASINLNLAHLPSGIYNARLLGDQNISRKILIAR